MHVVRVGVTSHIVKWTTGKGNFSICFTPFFHFVGYNWYLQCSVNDHDMYRITLKNQIDHVHIEEAFYVTSFLKVNQTTFFQSVKYVENPQTTIFEFHKNDIGFDFLGLNDAGFTVVCQFDVELPHLVQEICSRTSSPFAQSISSQTTAESTSTDSDRAVCTCSSVEGKRLLNKSTQTSLEIPPALESLSRDFCNLLNNEHMPDVQLKCRERAFSAHRAVLAARSEVFAAMFKNKMAESESGIVDVTDLDERVLKIFLEYIYTGRTATPTNDDLPKLYAAADKHAVTTLKRECSEWMIESLTKQNYLDILKLADEHSDQYLEAAVGNFVARDMELLNGEAWRQFEKKHPILANSVYRAVLKCQGVLTSK